MVSRGAPRRFDGFAQTAYSAVLRAENFEGQASLMKYMSLTCKNCNNIFVWSVEEQELYKKRGLEEPKYCPICRGIMEAKSRDTNRAKYIGDSK